MSTQTTESPTAVFHDIAGQALSEATIDTNAPVQVQDAWNDASAAIRDILTLATDVESKLSELNGQKDLIPRTGLERLQSEAREAASTLKKDAERRYAQAVTAAEDALLTSALPKLTSDSREALARQELEVALGDATGAEVKARILGIANSGSPEVQAILATPFARTVLIARGVAGVDDILKTARQYVAHSGSTPEAVKATERLEKLEALSGAAMAAASAFHHSLS